MTEIKSKYTAYVDEVGRGCLAGPVTACAVVIRTVSKLKIKNSRHGRGTPKATKFKIARLGDSKKLTPNERKDLYEIFTRIPYIYWAIASVYPKVIDRINIFEATKLAAKRAVKKLSIKPDLVVTDGNFRLRLRLPQKSVVKADEKFLPCSIASIIAKVTRDRMMLRLHKQYPQYGLEKHKGYGTKLHYKMLKKYGPSKLHRKSFRLT